MTTKTLPPFLIEEREKMMIDMRKKGYNFQQVADVFRVSKALVFSILSKYEPKKSE